MDGARHPTGDDAALMAELQAAARCAATLEAHGLHVAFRAEPTGLEIVLERADGTPIRRLGPIELLELATAPETFRRLAAQEQPALALAG